MNKPNVSLKPYFAAWVLLILAMPFAAAASQLVRRDDTSTVRILLKLIVTETSSAVVVIWAGISAYAFFRLRNRLRSLIIAWIFFLISIPFIGGAVDAILAVAHPSTGNAGLFNSTLVRNEIAILATFALFGVGAGLLLVRDRIAEWWKTRDP